MFVYGRSRTIEEQITNTKCQSSHHDTAIRQSSQHDTSQSSHHDTTILYIKCSLMGDHTFFLVEPCRVPGTICRWSGGMGYLRRRKWIRDEIFVSGRGERQKNPSSCGMKLYISGGGLDGPNTSVKICVWWKRGNSPSVA
jgi:hypothetical protein